MPQYCENPLALTSKITAYDLNWPNMFAGERNCIAPIFGDALVDIHHVGSTAVPSLAAKPEIDLLVVVNADWNSPAVEQKMISNGYTQGEDLSPGHRFFRKDFGGVRTHKVHVCSAGHWQIARMLHFRDRLLADAELRARYQQLKLELEQSNTKGMVEYLAGKAPFIDAVVGPKPAG